MRLTFEFRRLIVENRVRIVDVADALGLSTATVSNVIHGKTKKISDETVKRVQEKLDEMEYIPNMAGILLAQNNSRIIGVVINDGPKYEGKVLEDGFVMASLNALEKELNERGYFEETDRIVNLVIDHYDGGYQAGKYLRSIGHEQALCISDNYICMDEERIEGFKAAFAPGKVNVLQIPILKEDRHVFYQKNINEIMKYTAVFAVSDYYALDFMHFVQREGIRVPEDISVIGFDDNAASRENIPALTTIHQDAALRAKTAMNLLEAMHDGKKVESRITLPVELIIRDSTGKG